jgi:hypothetical protein
LKSRKEQTARKSAQTQYIATSSLEKKITLITSQGQYLNIHNKTDQKQKP